MHTAIQSSFLKTSLEPFNDQLHIIVDAGEPEEAFFKLYNVFGVAVHRQSVDLCAGENQIILQVHELPSGEYYLHCKTEKTKMFIVLMVTKGAS
jgi:hypothetical protein